MSNAIKELFSDDKYALEEANRCREVIKNPAASHKEKSAAIDSLGFNLVSCSSAAYDSVRMIYEDCDARLQMMGRIAAKELFVFKPAPAGEADEVWDEDDAYEFLHREEMAFAR